MKRLRVLIADDERMAREGMRNYIPWEKEGLTLAGCVENGVQALAFLQEHPVDILITDIKMPLLSGTELLNEIVRREFSVLVIVISAYDNFAYAKQAIQSQIVFDYVLKPLLPEEFIPLLRRASAKLREKKTAPEMGPVVPDGHIHCYEQLAAAVLRGQPQDGSALLLEEWEQRGLDRWDFVPLRRAVWELLNRIRQTLLENGTVNLPFFGPRCAAAELLATRDALRLREYIKKSLETDFVSRTPPVCLSPLIAFCIGIIRQRYALSGFSLAELAEEVLVSPNYLSTCFKQDAGAGFSRYLNLLRVSKAMELLSDMRRKTYEVSAAVGFEDARYFSRIFREYTGLTPSEYRQTASQL